MNNAYITLLSSKDYLPAVLILNQNLKDLNCKYPLVVMITDDIISDVYTPIFKSNIAFEIVPRLSYTQSTIEYWAPISDTVINTASKIQLFTLHKYDKLVYIDADSIFISNPDCLFDKPDGAMYNDHDDMGFSGLFVCCPSAHPFEYYEYLLKNKGGLDGDLLGNLWFPFKTNPDYRIDFSWFINIVTFDDSISLPSEVKGIHFCNKYKPWNYTNAQSYINDLNMQFPMDSNNNRFQIADFYIRKYLLPLKQKWQL